MRVKWYILALLVWLLGAYGTLQLSRSTEFQVFGEAIARVETDQKVVALTLDDGPSPKYLEDILRTLGDAGVPATFYLVGEPSTIFPEAVERIAAAGHEIGNHSYTHPRMVLMRPSVVAQEIEDTDVALRAAGYAGPLSFRPPYGMKLLTLPWYLAQTGRPSVMWDIDPEEWHGSTQARVERARREVRPGSIILLHLMWDHSKASRDLLGPMIAGLQEDGYQFVTISTLLSMR